MGKNNHRSAIVYFSLSLITIAAFWGVHKYEFINLDDPVYIVGNQNVQHGFTPESLKWAFTSNEAANWHPFTWLSHMLDFKLFGLNPGAHHIINLLIHILNVLLLFAILKNTTGAVWQSAFAACLFAIHPLRVESVAWAAERKDVLSTLFWMLATIAYIRYCRRPNINRYMAVFILLGLGLMSKPMLVTLPFVLLLMDYWPIERFKTNIKETSSKSKSAKGGNPQYTLAYLIAEKMPLFVLIIVSSVITFIVQQKGGAMDTGSRFSLASRVANSVVSYIIYILKMLWPSSLAPFYPHPGEHFSIVLSLLSAAALLIVSILAIRFGKTYKYLPVGWFWYLGTLVPVIGLIQVGEQAYADRYSYVPVAGLFIIIAWMVPQLISKLQFKKIALVVSASIIIVILTICTYIQQSKWQNSITLFEHAIKATKDNYHAHFCIAEPLRAQGRFQEAIYHNAECLKIKPEHCEALNSMGLAMLDAGQFDDAIKCFEKAIKLKPHLYPTYANLGLALAQNGRNDDAIALYRKILLKSDSPIIHSSLAYALWRKGDKDEAIKEYEKVLVSEQSNANAHFYIGVLLAEQGKNDESAAHLQKAFEIKPDYWEAYSKLGEILAGQGQYDLAVRRYNEALKIAPEMAEIHFGLGSVLARRGEFNPAAAEYDKVLRIQPYNYVAHTYLGATLLKLGRTNDAIRHFNQALKINPDYAEAKIILQSIK